MTILKMVKAWLKDHDWPTEPVRLGPGSCGQGSCKTQHAYAEAVGRPTMFSDKVVYVFIYDRPCNYHESVWDRAKRKEMGLGVR